RADRAPRRPDRPAPGRRRLRGRGRALRPADHAPARGPRPRRRGGRPARPQFTPGAESGLMAELLETRELTDPTQRGWAVDYLIRRSDGEELHVEVRCWDQAREAAQHAGNDPALAAIEERGIGAALEAAERAESPAARGAVMISIWFDPAGDGALRERISYERAQS